ncbi:MAG: O-antigen ligase family protein [Sphingomicrobium sp.]
MSDDVSAVGSFVPRGGVTYVDKWIALAGLFALLMLNIALPVWKISTVPIRGLFAGALLVALGALYPAHAARAVRENGQLLGLVAGLALIGIFVSAVNGLAPGVITQAVIEMHLQAAVMIMVAFIVAYICGARACMLAIIGAIALSGLTAMLQAVGIDAAWDIRHWLAGLQNQEVVLESGKNRPLGLSFSPIQLATQLCLAFAVYAAVRDKQRQHPNGVVGADPAVFPALLVFAAVAVACGTRSPILGALLFFAFYAAQRRGTWLSFLIMLGGLTVYLLGPMLLDMIQSTQPRLVETDDKSATGRMSLFTFGLILFRDNPLGYGLEFSPTDHWTDYWHYLYTLPSAVVVQTQELHNYALNMLNTYGIGLLLLVPTIFGLLRRGKASLLFFIPYVVHIAFHNSGPLWNDMIIWFVVAAISVAGQNLPVDQRHEHAGAHGRRRQYSHRSGPHPRPYPG